MSNSNISKIKNGVITLAVSPRGYYRGDLLDSTFPFQTPSREKSYTISKTITEKVKL